MIQFFKSYIEEKDLFERSDKILLAVSGGMDSVSLCHLFVEAGFSFGVAHCNFNLRGEASDGDAKFVKAMADGFEVACFITAFDTKAFAENEKISIQMAARDLRYEWLEKIRQEQGFDYIATAHHLNDSIETVIYNFAKGCGIRGLHGIQPKNGKIIRPMLFAKRIEIETYVQSNALAYREDASNASDKYSRNFIRHQIVPLLKTLNTSFEKTAEETIDRLRETEILFDQSIQFYKDKLVEKKGDEWYISFKKIPPTTAHTILYEILKPRGFNGDQIKMLLRDPHQSGASFFSKSHVLLIDRDRYIVCKHKASKFVEQDINLEEESVVIQDQMLSFEVLEKTPSSISKDVSIALLDFKQLTFPLQLRPWKAGDVFQPFGMNGKHQKLQDFLTNRKLSRFDKSLVHVLESDGKICWVVGMRIDERFKITENTSRVYKVSESKIKLL